MTKDVENQAFHLRTMLLWTIHDFPGYGTVGGFSHQGYAVCPWCGMDLGTEHAAAYETWKANGNREGSARDPSKIHGVKRISILFRLLYWKVSILP